MLLLCATFPSAQLPVHININSYFRTFHSCISHCLSFLFPWNICMLTNARFVLYGSNGWLIKDSSIFRSIAHSALLFQFAYSSMANFSVNKTTIAQTWGLRPSCRAWEPFLSVRIHTVIKLLRIHRMEIMLSKYNPV